MRREGKKLLPGVGVRAQGDVCRGQAGRQQKRCPGQRSEGGVPLPLGLLPRLAPHSCYSSPATLGHLPRAPQRLGRKEGRGMPRFKSHSGQLPQERTHPGMLPAPPVLGKGGCECEALAGEGVLQPRLPPRSQPRPATGLPTPLGSQLSLSPAGSAPAVGQGRHPVAALGHCTQRSPPPRPLLPFQPAREEWGELVCFCPDILGCRPWHCSAPPWCWGRSEGRGRAWGHMRRGAGRGTH